MSVLVSIHWFFRLVCVLDIHMSNTRKCSFITEFLFDDQRCIMLLTTCFINKILKATLSPFWLCQCTPGLSHAPFPSTKHVPFVSTYHACFHLLTAPIYISQDYPFCTSNHVSFVPPNHAQFCTSQPCPFCTSQPGLFCHIFFSISQPPRSSIFHCHLKPTL